MSIDPSDIQVVEVSPENRRLRKLFLDFPFQLYKDTPQWVPPLSMDTGKYFDTRKNPFYQNGEACFLLALNPQGMVRGRLAVLHNRKYNEFNHEKSAFFYLFECENSREVSRALFNRAIEWVRERELDKLIGPRGFSAMDGLGLLVRGFEHRPAFGLPYNPPYYQDLIESLGFIPLGGDIVSGYLSSKKAVLPEKVERVAELVERRRGLHAVRLKSRRELQKLIPAFQKLYNESLEGTSGNVPLTEADLSTMADQLLWFADPRLIKIIQKGDELVGYLLAYPDISAAIQRCRGRLFPFGWLDMLLEVRRTKWVNINGAAILDPYRGLGGTALLFKAMNDSIREGGFEHAEVVQIGTDNEQMQLELRELGIDFYKCHRQYQLHLSSDVKKD